MDRGHLRALALAFFAALASAPGCGRSLQNRDATGDTAVDVRNDPDSRTPADVPADLAADVPADVPIDVPPDAQVDRADGGPTEMDVAPDLAPPEAGQDVAPETGQDVPPDVGLPEVGQDLMPDRRPPDAGQDVASDRNPDVDTSCIPSPWDVRHCGTCDHDCTKLPHVNTSIESLSCRNGVCNSLVCELGYGHCSPSANGDEACETDLWNDTNNCGACANVCGRTPGSSGVCHKGACVGECPAMRGDCTDDFGCETYLATPEHCGACGRPACPLANVVAPCRQPGSTTCGDGICAPGYGNCERTNADCEAAYGSAAATCLPAYKETRWLPTGQDGVVAVRPDRARFIGGRFEGTIDFDFTADNDTRSPPEAAGSPYVTMVKADGGYGWTRAFRATGAVTALAAAADGGVIVAGTFQSTIILNPDGTGGTLSSPTGSAFLVKLNGNGLYVWGFIMETSTFPAAVTIQSLAVAGDGSIYAGGSFNGGIDFDPGSAAVIRQGDYNGSPFILKLTGDRGFVWVDTWKVDPQCVIYPGRIAVSPAGVWASGNVGGSCDFDPGPAVDLKQPGLGGGGVGYVLAVDPAGRYVGGWLFGKWVSDVVADSQGAVYAVGEYSDTIDFDLGPGEVLRTATDYPSSFVIKLGAAGAFQWVTTPTRFSARAIALGRNGAALVAGFFGQDGAGGAGVIELLPDQSPGWTVGFGSPNMRIVSLASTPNGFFVGGYAYWTTDMDPGPGTDNVPGGTPSGNPFVSEYAYGAAGP